MLKGNSQSVIPALNWELNDFFTTLFMLDMKNNSRTTQAYIGQTYMCMYAISYHAEKGIIVGQIIAPKNH